MTARTEERWPPADTLVEYLEEYAAPQGAAGHIRYNTTVTAVNRGQNGLGFVCVILIHNRRQPQDCLAAPTVLSDPEPERRT